METPNDNVEEDAKNPQVPRSSSDSDSDDKKPGSSTAQFKKSKKRVKRRSYRTRVLDGDEANASSSTSNIDENNKPGSSTGPSTFHKLKKRFKQRSYRVKSSDGDEADSSATVEESEAQENSDDSDSESDDNNPQADEETSDGWSTTEEDQKLLPPALRKIIPKNKLSIIRETVDRQIGDSRQFQRKIYGSLHMVQRLKLMHALKGHTGCVNTVEFNQKGDLLVSGSDDLTIIIWNWATGKKLNSYESGHRNNIFQATWVPDGEQSRMVTCASDGQLRILDLVKGTTRKLASHRGACNKFTIHPDAPNQAISVGDDGKILCTDLRYGSSTRLAMMKERNYPVQIYSIHSHPLNSSVFCIGGHSSTVKLYDYRKFSVPFAKLCPKNLLDNDRVHITSVTFNQDGTEVLASYNDDDIYLFDTRGPYTPGDYAHKYEGHRNNRTIKGVSYFGPDGNFIVSGSDCGHVYFWEKNSEAIVQWLHGDAQGVVNCVKPHPYIPILATSGLDDDVKIWVPNADEPSLMPDLKKCVFDNRNERRARSQCRSLGYDTNLFCITLENFYENRGLLGHLAQSRNLGPYLADDDYDYARDDEEEEDEEEEYDYSQNLDHVPESNN